MREQSTQTLPSRLLWYLSCRNKKDTLRRNCTCKSPKEYRFRRINLPNPYVIARQAPLAVAISCRLVAVSIEHPCHCEARSAVAIRNPLAPSQVHEKTATRRFFLLLWKNSWIYSEKAGISGEFSRESPIFSLTIGNICVKLCNCIVTFLERSNEK